MLILVNLALNSPSSAESVETQPPSSTVAVTGSEHTTKAEEGTTVKPTEKSAENATQKPTKKPDEKKENSKNSESSSKAESSNNSSLENSYNYYSSSGNSSSGSSSSSKSKTSSSSSKNSSSSSKSNSSSNTQKATQKPTTKPTSKPESKPTTKPTQPQDNVYLSYSSITVTKGDVVFLSLINAGNGVSWSVSNSSVLQNYGGGSNQCNFKALKKGSATVTASYNGKNYYCTVSVN